MGTETTTVTLLFCDLVESTRIISVLGDDAASTVASPFHVVQTVTDGQLDEDADLRLEGRLAPRFQRVTGCRAPVRRTVATRPGLVRPGRARPGGRL